MKNCVLKKITNFVVLIAICFGLVSCSLNTDATSREEAKIHTGACGETAENHDDVIEIDGKKYYTTQSNYYKDYYSENIYTTKPVEVKTPYTEETKDLFHEIRVKYWREWLENGVWQEKDTPQYKVYIKGDEVKYKSQYDDSFLLSTLELLKDKSSSFVGIEQGVMKIYNGLLTVSPSKIYTTLNHTYKNLNL